MRDFFSFETFITPSIIRGVFVAGLVLLLLGTIARIAALLPYRGVFSGLLVPIVGLLVLALLWRIYCEVILVFFDIRDKVSSLAHRPLS